MWQKTLHLQRRISRKVRAIDARVISSSVLSSMLTSTYRDVNVLDAVSAFTALTFRSQAGRPDSFADLREAYISQKR